MDLEFDENYDRDDIVGQTKLIEDDTDQSCKLCPLHETRNNIVWERSTSDKDVDALFIGEAPGKDEDIQGKPFVGRAGKILDNWIFEVDLLSYAIVNIVKCRPPNNRKPHPNEIRACLPYLIKQIQQFNPKIIVALGATPCSVLTNRKELVVNIGKRTVYVSEIVERLRLDIELPAKILHEWRNQMCVNQCTEDEFYGYTSYTCPVTSYMFNNYLVR